MYNIPNFNHFNNNLIDNITLTLVHVNYLKKILIGVSVVNII